VKGQSFAPQQTSLKFTGVITDAESDHKADPELQQAEYDFPINPA
jgi:hypothetical protein